MTPNPLVRLADREIERMNRASVLAVCTTAIGDTILCTPALKVLSQDYNVDVLIHQHRRPLLEAEPHLRKLYTYRNNALQRFILAQILGRRSYDRLVLMHANKDILKLLPRLRYQRGVTYKDWQAEGLGLENLTLPDTMHVADKRLALAAWAGAKSRAGPVWIHLRDEERQAGEAWLVEHNLGPDRRRVALCPGAANVFKCWPADRFGQTARDLRKQDIGVYLIGARNEGRLMDEVDRAAGSTLPRLSGAPLRLAAGVLARTDLLITNDTGPLHLGQAVGASVLALFGPTSTDAFGPRGPNDRTIKVPPTCEVCLTKKCMDPVCLEALTTDRVLAEAIEILSALRPRSERSPHPPFQIRGATDDR